MAKGQKITKKELKELQATQSRLNQTIFNLGLAVIAQNNGVNAHAEAQKVWNEFEQKLNQKYGNVSINMQDGTIGPQIKEEEPTK